ncbi:unnamed protein product [Lactuca virosa]|uniref:Uncharacterized protein n=1 Tax=Lactuca virosa TaxID=75947 RepID=A0AAU9NEM2_9ASTR|nr:unnamed protein product [Lactuca virosa]
MIPTKTRVLKRTKKPPKKPSESPIKTTTKEPVVESAEPKDVEFSNPISSQGGPKKVQKPKFTRRGVLFREVPVPGSPDSKKHRAIDMAKKLNKKRR